MSGRYELIPLKSEPKKKITDKVKDYASNLTYARTSPCPWADYLKCVHQTPETIDKIYEDAKLFMSESKNIDVSGQKGGQKGGSSNVDSYIALVKSTIKLGKEVQKQIEKKKDKLMMERTKAAAAISYISRLFVLGMEKNVDDLRDYTRKHQKMDLDDVMYNLASYIKNTRQNIK